MMQELTPKFDSLSINIIANVSDHSSSTYAKFPEKLTFLAPNKHKYVCVSGVRIASFSANFVQVLNERSPI